MASKAWVCAAAGAALLLSSAPAAAGDADDLSARELATQAKDHLLDVESVHLKLTDRGADARTSGTQPTSMDLSLDQAGDCVGTMRMGSDGGSVEIVKQGDEVWMKPDTAFWKAQVPGSEGDAVAKLFGNRYIHGSTDDAMLKGMADICDLTAFQKDVDTAGPSGDTPLTKGEETTVDDTRVIPLKGSEDGMRTTLYVTSDAPHRLVSATQKGAGTDMTLAFTDYDKPVPTKTPPAEDSVEVGKLREELESV
ncbi:lipoprotein [Streptomyces resistomycificus]|uniref:Lipoprotein n=1 Tax=Streptomyces resistomycificus TaxID=67356 RepID=A0A0L8L775_9ACTN|nr:lipoprotein [Streptomyces resistomycificus]KOG34058.1 lipoprotein [Streptomyces resistomycificus]KUN92970.1 hypothetical protein AQJ84_30680 [Streptomyces resistomycificus]